MTAHDAGPVRSGRFDVSLVLSAFAGDRVAGRVADRELSPSGVRMIRLTPGVQRRRSSARRRDWACASRSRPGAVMRPGAASRRIRRRASLAIHPRRSARALRVGRARGGGPGAPGVPVPTDPIASLADTPLQLADARSPCRAMVPYTYDPRCQTPTTLFVWLHGRGGEGSGDVWTVDPGGQDWISIAGATSAGTRTLTSRSCRRRSPTARPTSASIAAFHGLSIAP